MKYQITLFLLGVTFLAQSQTQNNKLDFSYDAAGNQVSRVLCINCASKPNKEIKEIETITEKELEKFFAEDVISYYPNPVKQELFLKWELKKDNTVSSLQVFNANGQLLQSRLNFNKNNMATLEFGAYLTGMYLIVLNYSNGEQETIKIVKQ